MSSGWAYIFTLKIHYILTLRIYCIHYIFTLMIYFWYTFTLRYIQYLTHYTEIRTKSVCMKGVLSVITNSCMKFLFEKFRIWIIPDWRRQNINTSRKKSEKTFDKSMYWRGLKFGLREPVVCFNFYRYIHLSLVKFAVLDEFRNKA